MIKKIINLFKKHPNEVGETYFEHFQEAMTISARMYFCFVAQAVHAVFPFLKPPRGTDIVAMWHFCRNHTPEERKRRKTIKVLDIQPVYINQTGNNKNEKND